MDESWRVGFVMGYSNGSDWMGVKVAIDILDSGFPKDKMSKISATLMNSLPKDMSVGELSQSISKLYDEDPTNAPIPIVAMIDVVILKSQGASGSQIEQRLEHLRAFWRNP